MAPFLTAETALAVVETQGCGDIKSACIWLSEYLHPVASLDRSGISNEQPLVQLDTVKVLAKQYGGLITRLLKAISIRLSNAPQQQQEAGNLQSLGRLCCASLEALDVLRPVLKSSATDLEVQRYGFVRKLTAVGMHEPALRLGLSLYSRSKALTLPSTHSTAERPSPPSQPAMAHDLLSASITTILVCATDLSRSDPHRLEELIPLVKEPLVDYISMLQ